MYMYENTNPSNKVIPLFPNIFLKRNIQLGNITTNCALTNFTVQRNTPKNPVHQPAKSSFIDKPQYLKFVLYSEQTFIK